MNGDLINSLSRILSFPLIEQLVFLGVLVVPLLTICALIDIARRPGGLSDEAGLTRLIWAGIVLFVGIIGPIVYLVAGRRQLDLCGVCGPLCRSSES